MTATAKTAEIISFRTGHTVTPGHAATLGEVLSRDGCRCAHCRAPGGAMVLYGSMGPREVYVRVRTLLGLRYTVDYTLKREVHPSCANERF